ncbi:tRNA (5-methylaminomethyl-2-thiouridine)(34)-methyltransferase MnmD [Sphingobacterium spiritivorum]|uniref:tRNA (5-methylaminomethyl-2-thiouridine)(34)-methyltransferase MnmD n=1 Tax=Sphingobacterium spiritivorum TaxID=258 RepID=UPI001919A56A|nr:tRNA (5-methylaminomethyl-2-thiouridine)(34)-methyltransferase MnmD [Sphingobacterium spiritivorum]QQT27089.1 tRNA (5-methylaminomethyl-2-thiouridine)(34)-methyltransferase MnmD [Sphingobacterium spiritivorum]
MDFVITGDGSKTLFNAEIGECYHSKHGALQESKHVFIQMGLDFYVKHTGLHKVSVLEIGFGTGLNFLQTAEYVSGSDILVDYVGIEGYPLPLSVIKDTGYDAYVDPLIWNSFTENYTQSLDSSLSVTENMNLHIAHTLLMDFTSDKQFDVVYFDAFAAVHQPEMWSDEALGHIAQYIKPGGMFVTYAITGNLKRSMKALGFEIEKAPGAPGKREMLRAIKY